MSVEYTELHFLELCKKCSDYFEEYFENDGDICNGCMKKIKNKCEVCGCKGVYNFEEFFDYGVRCKNHKEDKMVNLHTIKFGTKRFKKIIEEKIGGKVVGEYKGCDIPVDCFCPENHPCNPRPSDVIKGNGMCKICAGNDFETSKNNFYENIEEKIGGKVVGEYKGANEPVDCFCPEGHPCKPTPAHIQQGHGMCKVCANSDFETAKNNFYENIEEKLGGKVVGKYLGKDFPVDCFCPKGHPCNPIPSSIQQGHGMCRRCVGKDFETAKNNFYENIEEKLGGKVVGDYKGKDNPVDCFCPKGHPCKPIPTHIQQGQGMCRRCKQSGGELLISRALEKLNINFFVETYNNFIKNKLRYDFYFEYNNKKFYIEMDGGQHFKYLEFFHSSLEEFQERRQIDLFKNYVAKLSNIKIIRISYKQIKISLEEFSAYLKSLFDREEDVVVDCELYKDWIFENPTEETIEKYMKEEI